MLMLTGNVFRLEAYIVVLILGAKPMIHHNKKLLNDVHDWSCDDNSTCPYFRKYNHRVHAQLVH